MSVRFETYVILGVDLNLIPEPGKERNAICESLEPLELAWCGEDAEDTRGILWDGMGEDYVLAGHVIAVSGDDGGLNARLVFNTITGTGRYGGKTIPKGLYAKVERWMTENDLWKFTDQGVRLHILTHYH